MASPSLLIVDDDASIRDALSAFLQRHGYRVRSVEDAQAMDRALASAPVDLVVLDLMMPGEDGLSVCRRLGQRGVPILMLSAMGEATDRVVGLEVGADDYLAKPFEPRELLARVRALLRRHAMDDDGVRSVRFAGWQFSFAERILLDPSGHALALTLGEASLLHAFTSQPGRILSRDRLMDVAWDKSAESFDRAVDLQVSRLRRKLAERDDEPLIETLRGQGYRFLSVVVQVK